MAPSLVEIDAPLGKLEELPLTVFNDGARPVAVEVLMLDFDLDPSGVVVMRRGDPGAGPWSAAGWLGVSKDRLVLGPGEERDMALAVAPPSDAEPGTHRALVNFRATATDAAEEGVVLRANVATLVLVKVPGNASMAPRVSVDVPRVVFGDPVATVRLANDGRVHYFAEGVVRFAYGDPKPAAVSLDTPRHGALVLSGEDRVFKVSWRDSPWLGKATAIVEVRTTGGDMLSSETAFWMVRWPIVAVLVGVLVAAVALYVLSRRYRLVRHVPG